MTAYFNENSSGCECQLNVQYREQVGDRKLKR